MQDTSTIRSTRGGFVAGVAFVAVQALAIYTASADPTTLGVEWENSQVRVDLRQIAEEKKDPEDEHTKIPFYLRKYGDVQEPVHTRVLCTKDAYAPKVSGFPLVSLTWDMGGLDRTLEIVTGPVEAMKNADWAKVLDYIQLFHHVLEDACTADKTFHVDAPEKGCAVPAAEILTRLNAKVANSTTTECYTDHPEYDNKDPARTLFLVRSPDHALGTMRDQIRRIGSVDPNDRPTTQVSISLDLENYTKDISTLFGNQNTIGYRAWKHFNDTLKAGLGGGLTDEQKAFVALYFTEFHVLLDYLYEPARRNLGVEVDLDADKTLTKLLLAAPIKDSDAVPLKNSFSLLAKTALNTIYKKLVDTDPQRLNVNPALRFPTALFTDRNAKYFCDAAFLQYVAKKIDTCKEFHDEYWKKKIVTDDADPLSLAKIAGTVIPIVATANNKLRVVFEMRSGTTLIDARRIAIDTLNPFVLKWNGVIALPQVLPVN